MGRGYVRRAHAAGVAVRPWVVNGERKLARYGDAFLEKLAQALR